LDGVGVEKFAYHAWQQANELVQAMTNGRCSCVEVECAEHGANSAIYTPFHVQTISFVEGQGN
jgi:hypothetical protein